MARFSIAVAAISIWLSACATQHRASVASRAQSELVGMSKKDLLMCAGVPVRQDRADDLEFLTYGGGGDSTTAAVATSQRTAVSKTARRYCEATFVLKDGVVQQVTYQGRTGGLFSKGEQCAFIVENCVQ